MRITKLHYVFSFILILFTCLSEAGYAQEKGKIQKGSATWYGAKYHGRKTTSGEIYNKNQMTAAHPTLPFGTKVKVTNTVSRKSVIVRINDRGPFGKKGCIIDLSEAAARKIDIHRHGYGKVTVQILPAGAAFEKDEDLYSAKLNLASDAAQLNITNSFFVVQAGSFANQNHAQLQSDKIKAYYQYLPVFLKKQLVKGQTIHRVLAGRFGSRAEAEELKALLAKKGISVMVKSEPLTS